MLLHGAAYRVQYDYYYDDFLVCVCAHLQISAFAGHKKRGPVDSFTRISITTAM